MKAITRDALDQAFHALSAFLEDAGAVPEGFVLIGGSALLALGLLVEPRPLSEALQAAALRVARELGLDEQWLNTGPADQVRAGLPEGFLERLTPRQYGRCLTVYLASRYDLIHLKLFAAVDQGMGRHVTDLTALAPADDELLAAARWVLTQDAGEVFPELVCSTLKHMGYEGIAGQL